MTLASHEVRDDEPLALEALEQMALANNPSLQQAAAAIEIAAGQRTQAGLPPNPTVGYVASEVGNGGNAGQQGAFVSQQFITAGKLDLSRAVAEQDVQQAHWRREVQRRQLLRAVRVRYYEVLAARRAEALADQLQQTAQTALHASQRRLEAGEAARPDVRQTEIQAAQTRILVAQAKNRLQAAVRRLANIVGNHDLDPSNLQGTLEADPQQRDWDATWQRLREQSPNVQIALTAVRRAELALQRAEVQPIPNLNTQAGVQYDYDTLDTVANLQVGVSLPLMNRNQGNIHAAQAALNGARQELGRVELRLRDRLAAAFDRFQTAQARVATFRDTIIPAARESAELVTKGYEQGEFDITRVLVAQRTLFQASLDQLDALIELRRSMVEIDTLVLEDGTDSFDGQ